MLPTYCTYLLPSHSFPLALLLALLKVLSRDHVTSPRHKKNSKVAPAPLACLYQHSPYHLFNLKIFNLTKSKDYLHQVRRLSRPSQNIQLDQVHTLSRPKSKDYLGQVKIFNLAQVKRLSQPKSKDYLHQVEIFNLAQV